jgi:hypothetical protein
VQMHELGLWTTWMRASIRTKFAILCERIEKEKVSFSLGMEDVIDHRFVVLTFA